MLLPPLAPLRAAGALVSILLLAACGSTSGGVADGRSSYKVGSSYTIAGRVYTPDENYRYNESGMASWYGPGFHGKRTANGEAYDQAAMTAAHRTLPMPSVVRVTNLSNGSSVIVRVNDRGPFANDRIIDLSRAAAEKLDMVRAGTASVRVEILPEESKRLKEVALNGGSVSDQIAAMRGAPAAAPRTAIAATSPAPPPPPPSPVIAYPAPSPAPSPTITAIAASAPPPSAPTASGYFVQAGAFSTRDNAERVRATLAHFGDSSISQTSFGPTSLYRVRLGPFASANAAQTTMGRVQQAGYRDARVVNE
jgi:rare lipoprotein A